MKRLALPAAGVVLAQIIALNCAAQAQSGKVREAQAGRHDAELSLVAAGGGGYLGAFLGDINDARAKELNLAEARGALVGRVVEGSPAAKAGLKENDVILSYEGERVMSAAQVHRLLSETPAGRRVTLGIVRAGAAQDIQVALGERRTGGLGFRSGPFSEADALRDLANRLAQQADEMRRKPDEERARPFLEQSESVRKQSEAMRAEVERLRREGKLQGFSGSGFHFNSLGARYHLGVTVSPLSDQLAKFFNVKAGGGVLVTEVEADSAAARAGLKAGDCITAVDQERVSSPSDLNRLINRPAKDEKENPEVSLTVTRDRNELTIKAKPERREGNAIGGQMRGRVN